MQTIEKTVQALVAKTISAKNDYSLIIQALIGECAKHTLETKTNGLLNKSIIELRDSVDGNGKPVFSKVTINKLVNYFAFFIDFLNVGDEKYPTRVAKGTNKADKISAQDIEKILASLPKFTTWKKPSEGNALPSLNDALKSLIKKYGKDEVELTEKETLILARIENLSLLLSTEELVTTK